MRGAGRTIFVATICVACAAFIYSLMAPPVYKARSQIIIGTRNTDDIAIKDYKTLNIYVTNQYKRLESDDVLNEVIEKLHLRISKKFLAKDPLITLRKMVKITKPKDTSIINIDVYDTSAVLATRISGVLAEICMTRIKNENMAFTEKATEWLNKSSGLSETIKVTEKAFNAFAEKFPDRETSKELAMAQNKETHITGLKHTIEYDLERANREIKNTEELINNNRIDQLLSLYRDDAMIVLMKKRRREAKIIFDQAKLAYDGRFPKIPVTERELKKLDGELKNAEEADKKNNEEISASAYKDTKVIEDMKGERERLHSELEALKREKGEYPREVKEAEEKLAGLDEDIKGYVTYELLGEAKKNAENLRRKIEGYDKTLVFLRDRIRKLSDKRAEYDDLKRKTETALALYDNAKQDIEGGDVSIVDIRGMNVPDTAAMAEQVSPKILNNTLAGAAAGFMLGYFIVYRPWRKKEFQKRR